MLWIVGLASLVLGLSIWYLVLPIIQYLRDPKGLRKYPQLSIFSGISNVPFMIEASRGFRSRRLAELHKKHPVIRIGPNHLSYGTHRAIKDIYGFGSPCTKDGMYEVLAGSHYHLADVVDKHDHQRKRKVLSSAYAIKNLEAWEYKVADMTGRMVKGLEARCSEPLKSGALPKQEDLNTDFYYWANLFTVAAIANIGVSEDLRLLDQASDEVTSQLPGAECKTVNFRTCLFQQQLAQSTFVWAYDWYRTFVKLSPWLAPLQAKRFGFGKEWDGIIWSRAQKRFERHVAGEKLDDFFSSLMEDKAGVPNNLEWGEIHAEISIMMNAGSDTTAIAITNFIYHMIKNPAILTKLRKELDSVLDEDDSVAPYDKVKNLPYFRACIDESLRINPPNTFSLPRKTPKEGSTILDEWVAGETSVSMSAYVAHRDETVFPEPERFNPERWLGEAGKALGPFFIAFSAGSRGCIGRNISYLEQMVCLATLLRHFDFALTNPEWKLKYRETFTCSTGPMPVKIWKRDAPQVEGKA